MSKLLFIDLETGGLKPEKNPIIQIAGIVEINGKVKEEFDIKVLPDDMNLVEDEALKAIGLPRSEIHLDNGYVTEAEAFELFFNLIVKYLDTSKFTDKFYILGYNLGTFDVPFLRKFFSKFDLNYGYYFWYPPIDVLYLTGYACIGQRQKLGNFKLMTVAESLGIKIDIEKAHDALYDVRITKEIYELFRAEY